MPAEAEKNNSSYEGIFGKTAFQTSPLRQKKRQKRDKQMKFF